MCQRVDSPNVGMVCDIYHLQIMDGDLAFNIQSSIDWIAHFHTAGVPTRNELDYTQEDQLSIHRRGDCRHRVYRICVARIPTRAGPRPGSFDRTGNGDHGCLAEGLPGARSCQLAARCASSPWLKSASS